jgi:hypothetical protein
MRTGLRDSPRSPRTRELVVAQVGLLVGLEIDVHGVERDQCRKQRRVGLRQVADRHDGTAGSPVDRGTNLGELEIEPRAVERGLGGTHRRVTLGGRRLAGVELLARNRPRVD